MTTHDSFSTLDNRYAAPSLPEVDNTLRSVLSDVPGDNEEYWAFRDSRAYATALYQYPALMVPEVQRRVITALTALQGKSIRQLVDPFLGAGTVAVEGMLQGLDITGQDINPLAVLVSKTRTGPFHTDLFREAAQQVIRDSKQDGMLNPSVEFPGRDKWYVRENALALSKLQKAILKLRDLAARRFLWVVLAETARLTSNSRSSTYKLHIRPANEIAAMANRNPIELFGLLAERNLDQLTAIKSTLSQNGQLVGDRYKGHVSVQLGDSAKGLGPAISGAGYDLLVTSPPYGDNMSTVPYGQSSYLPLQWVDLGDIGCDVDTKTLRTTQEIDRRSLGGRWAGKPVDLGSVCVGRSPTLRNVLESLTALPLDRGQRVLTFFHDLELALHPMMESMKPNAYLVWTVGNRRVGGKEVPMDRIVSELITSLGGAEVLSLKRKIVSKRMATKNAIAPTMRHEIVLVFRKVLKRG